jgi:antirestriction protein ArdC
MTTQTQKTNPLFEKVTNQIVEALEKGLHDEKWTCPWDRMTSVAINAKTGRKLTGISQILCSMSMFEYGFKANKWMTLKQAGSLGGKVIKGSRSTLVVWLRPFVVEKVDGKERLRSPEGAELHQLIEEGKIIWSYRSAPYFNVEQIEGLDDEFYEPVPQVPVHGLGDSFKPVKEAEAFIELLETSNDPLKLVHQGTAAYYVSRDDKVVMPEKGKFHNEISYYGTLLHELGHWTGHGERLARTGVVDFDKFGSSKYAFEELIAELTATFKAAELGLEREVRKDHITYIADWIKVLKEDSKAIFKASGEAMKAVKVLNDVAVNQQVVLQRNVA